MPVPRFSRDEWSLVVQIAGLTLAFLYGLATRRNAPFWPVALLGLAVDIGAQVLIAGGGPGAFVGLFFLPLFFMLAGGLGRGLRWLVCAALGKPFK